MLTEVHNRPWRQTRQLSDSEPCKQTGGVEPRSQRGRATPRAFMQREGRCLQQPVPVEVGMSEQRSLSEQMAENPLANGGGASQPS